MVCDSFAFPALSSFAKLYFDVRTGRASKLAALSGLKSVTRISEKGWPRVCECVGSFLSSMRVDCYNSQASRTVAQEQVSVSLL